MKAEIIVTSDTHGKTEYLNELRKAYPKAALFLNLGDLEDDPRNAPRWICVRGNNDWLPSLPTERIIPCAGHRIFMTHSHFFPYARREEKIAAVARDKGCDIALYGHTHVGSIAHINGVLVVNPGSMRLPRDGKQPSYARLVIEDDGSVQAELIYMDDWPFEVKRSQNGWFW